MTALNDHDGKVSKGGRNISILWFAVDRDVLCKEGQDLEDQVDSLDKTCTSYKEEISAAKIKLIMPMTLR